MINGKKVLAITLARGGSSRVKKKNIADICGKPLLQYTTDEVNNSKYIDRYIVSTDDDDIREVCKKNGVEYYNRSDEHASSTSKTSDALIEVIENIDDEFDYIVEVMCTNPLKIVDDIDGCIEKISNTDADSVTAVVRVWDYHPSRVKYIENDLLKDFYPEILESRRQDLTPPAYIRNGSVYATTVKGLVESRTRLNGVVRPYIMPEERTINIDEPEDLELARVILNKKYNINDR